MAPPVYKVKLTRPQVFLWRMTLFLILAALLAIILDGQTQQLRHSFLANPGLNGLIIGVLIVGTVYAFRQVLRLYPEINWVNNFRVSDPGISAEKTKPVLLAPMATMLRDRTGHLSLATGSMRSSSIRLPPASTNSARPRATSSASSCFSACSARFGACCRR